MYRRTARSAATLNALVTTVTAGDAEPAFRLARVANARHLGGGGAVVEPGDLADPHRAGRRRE